MQFKSTFLALLAACASIANAQQSSAYTDPVSGITFQRYYDATRKVSFGIALPTNPTNEFIGQLSAPITNGWLGASFGGGMIGSLLLTAWDNGNSITHGFRMATSYSLPPLYTASGPVLTPICNTIVNSTHWTLTFRCQNCHTWQGGSFDLAGDFTIMGWAASDTAPANPADKGSSLSYHQGMGQFGMQLSAARNANYNTWRTCSSNPITSTTTTTRPPTSTTTTTRPPTSTTTTTRPPTSTTTPPGGGTQKQWEQCGGIGWNGGTVCISPYRCVKLNDYYSQCQ